MRVPARPGMRAAQTPFGPFLDIDVMTDTDLGECLDHLLDATRGAQFVFSVGASDVRSEEARGVLLERARRYADAAGALAALTPGECGPMRPWSPATTGPRDEVAVLEECEQRQDAVLVAYRDALELPLPAYVRSAIAREFDGLLSVNGAIATLRHRAERQLRQFVGMPM